MNTEQVINWLTGEAMRNTTYHNHKENMAWVATAFYISGVFAVGFTLRNITGCNILTVVTTFIILALIGIFCFTFMQFNSRWIAAGRVEGLIRTVDEIAAGKRPSDMVWKREEGKLYPKCIEDNIPSKARFNSSRILTELPSHAAIFIATVVALIILWSGYCPQP